MPTGSSYKFVYGVVVLFILLLACLVGAKLFAKASLVMLVIVAGTYVTFLISIIFKGAFDVPLPQTNLDKWYGDENGTRVKFENVTGYYSGFK